MENGVFLHVLRNLNSSAFQKSQYLAFLLFFAAFSLPKTAYRRLPPPTAAYRRLPPFLPSKTVPDRPSAAQDRPLLSRTVQDLPVPPTAAQDRSRPLKTRHCRPCAVQDLPVVSKTAQDRSRPAIVAPVVSKTFLWCPRPSCGVQDLPVVLWGTYYIDSVCG